jgi:seryl-tRNA synthetase
MLDPKILKKDIDMISENLNNKNFHLDKDLFLKLDSDRKDIIVETETLKNKKNILSKEIGILKSKGEDAASLTEDVELINSSLKDKKKLLDASEDKFKNFILNVPNILDKKVPNGNSEKNSKIIKFSNDKDLEKEKNTNFSDHSEIGKSLKLYDSDIASNMSGSRFSLLFGSLAQLHRALSSFMIDTHINNHKYVEVNVPLIVNSQSLMGTGQLPKFKDDLFELKNKEDFFLIPTAEVPLTNIFRDKILSEDELPVKYASLSTCFRSEAGSYGKDTKGLIRQHQFDKVELVNAVRPDSSEESLDVLISHAEKILDLLCLPYRKILLCSGDTGFSSSITYDLEVWMPSQNSYREISSCSNFKDFQARRMNIKYKNKLTKKKEYIHTLNGSGLAIGRTLASIIENFQNENGDVVIPEILRPYMNNMKFIKSK